MAFELAIDIESTGLEVEFATGSYVSENAKMFQGGTLDIGTEVIDVEFSTGAYVSESSKVFSGNTIEIDSSVLDVEFASSNYLALQGAIFISGTSTIFVSALPVLPGDEAVVIIFGIDVDFSATPRNGKAPLFVQFRNLSYGAIEAYEWIFGDGETSQGSEPLHAYKKRGVYDVTLRIRVEKQWFETTKFKYIVVYSGELIVSRTNRSFALGLLPAEGIGFSENTGEYPFPEAGENTLLVYDDDDQPHMLVLDNNDGFFYDIMQRDGPPGTGIEKLHLDKVNTDNTGGVAVVPLVKFPADTGTFEHFYLRHAFTYIFARSANEDKYRGATGYDAAGLPTGLELLLKMYVDGERTTAERQVKNLPITGSAHTDMVVEGHRLQLEVSANMGAHAIVGRKQEYIATDKLVGDNVMTEGDYQEELAASVQWFSRGYLDIDRATGAALPAVESAKLSTCAGPDGESDSGMEFTSAVNFAFVSLTNGSLLLWHQSLASITIGGSSVTLTQYATSGSWILSYARGITASGAVVITPTGTGRVFDRRMFNAALSDGAIEYYHDNIIDHDGDVVLP